MGYLDSIFWNVTFENAARSTPMTDGDIGMLIIEPGKEIVILDFRVFVSRISSGPTDVLQLVHSQSGPTPKCVVKIGVTGVNGYNTGLLPNKTTPAQYPIRIPPTPIVNTSLIMRNEGVFAADTYFFAQVKLAGL